MKTLEAFGWSWRDNGADVYVTINGTTYRVFVPIGTIHVAFGSEFAAAGCPFQPTVGAPTVGGLFSSIRKAASKIGKAAKRVVKKAARKVRSAAKATVRRVKRGALGHLRSAYRSARALSRGNLQGAMAHGMGSMMHQMDVLDPTGLSRRVMSNPQVRQGIVTASAAFPMTAPYAPALAAANRAYTTYQTGQRAARRIAAGERSPHLLQRVNQGIQARDGVATMARLAQGRDPRAMQIMGAFNRLGGGSAGSALQAASAWL
jgi:hypothetical protein